MPVYFISSSQIQGKHIEIDPSLSHHLCHVLRTRLGDLVRLVDESPKRYTARVVPARAGQFSLEIEHEELAPSSTRLFLRLGVGLLKRDQMDWIVQKATELGVSRISPVVTNRGVVRPRPERLSNQHKRWMKIAKEAAQQSCRWEIPQIDLPSDFGAYLSEPVLGFRFIFSERHPTFSSRNKIRSELSHSSQYGNILVGPEGGWAEHEIPDAVQAGYLPLSLGERILRTETAALAALAIVQYEAG
ncbi:MAG: 16S rRNA (uracil(1498)-N(3))-methyltransferase [Nitrospiria bacterium]